MNKLLFVFCLLAMFACSSSNSGADAAGESDSTAVAQDTVVLDTAGMDTLLPND